MKANGAWMWFLVMRREDRAPEIFPWCGGYSKVSAQKMLRGILEENEPWKVRDVEKTGLKLERLFVQLPDDAT